MIKPSDPRQLAIDIMDRSICSVRVGAAIADRKGRVVSWGWNSVGAGLGIHAEMHALSRASRDRLNGSTIYVASVRARNDKVIMSKPCEDCHPVLDKWGLQVVYRNASGEWIYE